MAKKDENPWRSKQVFHSDCAITVKGEGLSGNRSATILASTGEKDRDGDVIVQDGWQVAKRAPLLWGHDYKSLPIGKINKAKVSRNGLIIDAEFVPEGILEQADIVFELVKHGFVNSASVGFIPIEYRRLADGSGTEFLKQELIELSLVPVPANPSAQIMRMLKSKFQPSKIKAVFPSAVDKADMLREEIQSVSRNHLDRMTEAAKYLQQLHSTLNKVCELLKERSELQEERKFFEQLYGGSKK